MTDRRSDLNQLLIVTYIIILKKIISKMKFKVYPTFTIIKQLEIKNIRILKSYF